MRGQVSPSVNSRLAGQSSLGALSSWANSAALLGLKQGRLWPPFALSVGDVHRLARTFTPGDTCPRNARSPDVCEAAMSARKHLVDGRLCVVLASITRKRGAAISEVWEWGGPQTFRPASVRRDAFSRLSTSLKATLSLSKGRGDATEAGNEMLLKRQLRAQCLLLSKCDHRIDACRAQCGQHACQYTRNHQRDCRHRE